jgi:hypothetical protein
MCTESAVAAIQGATSASAVVQATAAIAANYNAIIKAIGTATTTILSGTLASTGGIAGSIAGLTQSEVNELTTAIEQAITLVENIGATLQVTATNLGPAVSSSLSGEEAALAAVITPFALPIQALAQAIASASASVSLTVTGLSAAAAGLLSISQQIAASI